jgi:hypothetical protein
MSMKKTLCAMLCAALLPLAGAADEGRAAEG